MCVNVSFARPPESECRRKWKTLRDQHRRERQREKDRRESGVGLFNYRPWRYSSILSFLNPFIDARAAGCNGWALDPQPSHLQAHEMGCSTTTDTRSDEDGEDGGGYGRYGGGLVGACIGSPPDRFHPSPQTSTPRRRPPTSFTGSVRPPAAGTPAHSRRRRWRRPARAAPGTTARRRPTT